MSRRKLDLIWQHDKVLPYLFDELKSKIELISPVHTIYLYGSRARKPITEWNSLTGKDWDIVIVCDFPIINTKAWTTDLNYHIDLKITDEKGALDFFKYMNYQIELYPNNKLA
ncbi:hypothetical protein GCM10007424_20520 [Flavobacterium suaedae]|uniref:Nucleotidyltransferase domain-containing protein n=1 Tax=Flavobacterium suaedae TaxID=1767027 RepID=A0ABQ1K0Y6_9FLAO|nr:nucleotidyltransferase domain-containing protein [Flavobacterium suaedae]GGB80306.1 hypothetical protein GCM10007424_20520 [Flavobacterium suaedae]